MLQRLTSLTLALTIIHMTHATHANAAVAAPDSIVASPSIPDPASFLKPAIDAKVLHAASAAVITPAGTRTAHAGRLSPDGGATPDDRTVYEIGSLSKVFTALLLADAVERGEVTLDTPIEGLLPPEAKLPEDLGKRITLEMLATHTSGLPRIPADIDPTDYTDPYARYGSAELWRSLSLVKLDFEPGTRGSYSNFAAGLLGSLLARRAGTSYGELLRTRITGPLEMNDTWTIVPAEAESRFAPGSTAAGLLTAHWNFQALAGAGAIRSTLADLRRFAEAALHPEKLTETSPDRKSLRDAFELAWTKRPGAHSAFPGGHGLGWAIAGDGETRWHNGMTAGFHAALFVNRKLGMASILLTNRATPVGSEIAERLLLAAAGLPDRQAPHADRAEVSLTAAQLDRLIGTYRLSPQFAFVIERRNTHLFVLPTGQSADMLFAASETTFFSRRVPAEIVFELPADGSPAPALTLHQGGRQMRGLREPTTLK